MALSSLILASLAALASLSCCSLSSNSFYRYSFRSANSLSYSSFFLAISSCLSLVSSSFALIFASLSCSFIYSFSFINFAFSSYLSMFPYANSTAFVPACSAFSLFRFIISSWSLIFSRAADLVCYSDLSYLIFKFRHIT